MGRLITNKTIKLHYECTCGYNCVDQFDTDKFTIKKLIELGYKIRKFKNTGERFYFRYDKDEVCPGYHYEDNN